MSIWFGILFINILWALNPFFVSPLVKEVGPENAAFYRYSFAFLSYFIYRFLFRKRGETFFLKEAKLKDWILVAIMGFGTAFLSPLFQSLGYLHSNSTHNVLLVSLEPAITLIFALLFLRERLSKKQYFGILLAALGLTLFLNLHHSSNFQVFSISGDIFFCLAFCGEALFSICAKKLNPKFSNLEVYGSAILYGVFFSFIYVFIQGLIKSSGVDAFIIPNSLLGWISIFYLGAIGSAATYIFWLYCLSKNIPVSKMAMSLFIQPLVGTVIGVFYFKDSLEITQWMGVLFLMASIWFSI